MTTERDLDTRLRAARGLREEELPALPAAFLDHLHASDARPPGPAPAPEPLPTPVPAGVLAAQQLVADAHRRRTGPVPPGRRRPGRRTAVRMSAAVLAVAAAWTAAVVVAGPEAAGPAPGGATRGDEVTLVGFDMPAFPLTLPTAPPGTSGPVFGGSGNGGASMAYTNAADPLEFVTVHVGAEPPPPGGSVGFPDAVVEDVRINGSPAVVVTTPEAEDVGGAGLDWQRAPGQWVTITAQGRYAERDLVTALAGALVDRPQAMPVQLHLAPAGYSLDFFKDDGRTVRLSDDADPTRGLVVRLPFPGETAPGGQVPDGAGGTAEPVEEVTVQGQRAELVRTDDGGGGPHGWVLRARLPDGTAFLVEAPGSLTREQVVEIADQVTYTP
ncbi:hypothetical protein [Geodermatophilus sp. CPCC 206100]|uniref:hypothetical protein n=1 Tax=Geodermatophilus sp. CPCC 206100 TaxID=3020054 RepID=UPI003AFF886C